MWRMFLDKLLSHLVLPNKTNIVKSCCLSAYMVSFYIRCIEHKIRQSEASCIYFYIDLLALFLFLHTQV